MVHFGHSDPSALKEIIRGRELRLLCRHRLCVYANQALLILHNRCYLLIQLIDNFAHLTFVGLRLYVGSFLFDGLWLSICGTAPIQ